MRTPFAAPFHQPGSLQCLLHPAVAECDLVFLLQLLVKMLHVQVKIPVPIQSQNLFHLGQRRSLGRRLASPPVKQPVIAELLIALMPPSHRPVTDADDFRCLPPGYLLGQSP